MGVVTVYIIDTSSLVTLHQWRPAAKNQPIWKNLDTLIRADRLLAPVEVYEELRAGNDALSRWALKRRKSGVFRPTTRQHVGIAKGIIHAFPEFVERDRPTPQADPFVVALAIHESRSLVSPAEQQIVVVTEEKFTPTGRPRMPHICAARGVRYMSIHQMYVNEGWTI